MGGSNSQTVTKGYKYNLSVLLGLCHGAVNQIRQLSFDDRIAWQGSVDDSATSVTISAPNLFGGDTDTGEGGVAGTIYLGNGQLSAGMVSAVEAGLGQPSPAYSGIATALLSGPGIPLRTPGIFGGSVPAGTAGAFYFGNSPYLKAPAIQVRRTTAGWSTAAWYPEKAAVPSGAFTGSWEYQIDSGPGDHTTPPDLINPVLPVSGWLPDAALPFGYIGPTAGFVPPVPIATPWAGMTKLWLRKAITCRTGTQVRLRGIAENSLFVFVNGAFVVSTNPTNEQLTNQPDVDLTFTVPAGENEIVLLALDELNAGGSGNITYLLVTDEIVALDMNPAHIVYQCLTDPEWGMGYPTADIDEVGFTSAADTLYDEGFGLSLGWFGQQSVEDFVQLILSHVNGVLRLDPSTGKFTLKLLRNDYDVNTLPTVNATNARLEGFSRASWGDLANEISITYEDYDGNEQLMRVQSLAAIAAQGSVVSKSLQFPGISYPELAARVAERELVQASTLLAQATFECDRSVTLQTGDVFNLEWPALGVVSLAMRVTAVDTGTLADGTLKIQAVEDIFSTPEYSAVGVQGSLAPALSSDAADLSSYRLIEVPYYTAVTETPAADFNARTPDSCFARFLGVAPSGLSLSYTLGQSPDDVTYSEVGTGLFSPSVTSSGAYGYLDTAITVVQGGGESVIPGDYCDWSGEVVYIEDADYDTGTLTVKRGCLDTLPILHADGELVIAINARGVTDTRERTESETTYYKALTRTPSDVLDIADATARSITFENRLERPYLPGDIKINSEYFPSTVAFEPLVVTWAHRDRTQQTAYPPYFTEGSVGPETGVTYTLELYEAPNTLLRTEAGLTGTSYTWATEAEDSGDFVDAQFAALLNFNGAGGSTDFVDATGKAWTRFGNAQISTAQSKWGGASGLFDGAGAYISTLSHDDFNVTDNDFTLEAWVWFSSLPASGTTIATKRAPSGADGGWQFGRSSAGKLQLAAYNASGAVVLVEGTTTLTTGAWYHLAASREGVTWRVFVNGALEDSDTESAAPTANLHPVILGRHSQSTAYDHNGYIDDFRVVKGKALYTAAFTPPLAQFVVPRIVSLLNFDGTNGSTAFTDEAGLVWTTSGSAALSTAQSKFGVSSVYFDGTGDRIGSPNLGIGATEEFTVEFWVRPAQVAVGCSVLDICPATGRGFLITQSSADASQVAVYIGDNDAGAYEVTLTSPTGSLAVDTWAHIAVTRERDTFRLFVDGALAGGGTWAGSVDWATTCYLGNASGLTSGYTGYIDGWRVTRGKALYTAAFAAPSSAPALPSTTALLNFNGVNGSTSIVDSAYPRTWTRFGNAQISTAQSKWGGSSLLLDGTGDFLTTPFTSAFLPSEDFTIECWVRSSNVSSVRVIAMAVTAGGSVNWTLVHNASGQLQWLVYNGSGGTCVLLTSVGALAANTWHHVAACRSGSDWRIFIDGAEAASGAHVGTERGDASLVYIGRQPTATVRDWIGYLDDFRIVKGSAKYTASFTPPAAQLEPGLSFGGYLSAVRVKLKSVRGGLDSWQTFDWTVTR